MAPNSNLFDVEYQDGTVILIPLLNLGEFAMMDLHEEAEKILALCEQVGIHHVIIDFCKTDYLESTALDFLILLHQNWATIKGRWLAVSPTTNGNSWRRRG